MQQTLDRRQPSARFRPQRREIPLQRRFGTAGNGETDPAKTLADEGPDLLALDVETAPAAAAEEGVQAEMAATGPEVLEEHGPALVSQELTGEAAPEDVGASAAPA